MIWNIHYHLTDVFIYWMRAYKCERLLQRLTEKLLIS